MLAVIFCSMLCAKAEAVSDQTLPKLESYIENTMDYWHVPGLAVGIVKNGKVIFLKGYGVRKLDQPDRVNTQTIFRIASTSKGFAAGLTGILVQDGVLNFEDLAIDHLEDSTLKKIPHFKKITVAHILGNTTGFPRHTYTNLLDENVPYSKIIKKLKNVSPQCTPGKCHGYQNVIYGTIADVIEGASGQSYSDLMMARVFKPLGMHHASLGCAAFKVAQNKAIPHKIEKGRYLPVPVNCRYYSVLPASGINANIRDMTQWLKAQMLGFPDILSKATLKKLHTPLSTTPREHARHNQQWRLKRWKDATYGMGWRILNYSGSGNRLIYHGGYVQGFGASIGFLPKQQIGIVVLTNSSTKISDIVLGKFFDWVLGLDEVEYNTLQKKAQKVKGIKRKSSRT